MSFFRQTPGGGPTPLLYRDREKQQDLILDFSEDGKLSTITIDRMIYSPLNGIMFLANPMNDIYNVFINVNNEHRMEASLRSSYDNIQSVSIHQEYFQIIFRTLQRFLDQEDAAAVRIYNTHYNQERPWSNLMWRVRSTGSSEFWSQDPLLFDDSYNTTRFAILYFDQGQISQITTHVTDKPPQRAYVTIIRNPDDPGDTPNTFKHYINERDERMEHEMRLSYNSVRRVLIDQDSFCIVFRCPRTFLGLANVLALQIETNATPEVVEGQLRHARLGRISD
jgi:hypothetical protein